MAGTAAAEPPRITSRDNGFHIGFHAMATPCEVMLQDADARLAGRVADAAVAEARRIEQKFSRYRADSVVGRIHASHGHALVLDEETARLIDFAEECFMMSGGLFDITSGVLRRAWRFDGSANVPAPEKVRGLLSLVGWKKVTWSSPALTLPAGMEIDLGGLAKEYAVDRTLQAVSALTDAPALVNFGGDLAVNRPRRRRRAMESRHRIGRAGRRGGRADRSALRCARHQRRCAPLSAEGRRALQPYPRSQDRMAGARCAALRHSRGGKLRRGGHDGDTGDAESAKSAENFLKREEDARLVHSLTLLKKEKGLRSRPICPKKPPLVFAGSGQPKLQTSMATSTAAGRSKTDLSLSSPSWPTSRCRQNFSMTCTRAVERRPSHCFAFSQALPIGGGVPKPRSVILAGKGVRSWTDCAPAVTCLAQCLQRTPDNAVFSVT